jgi:squalene/phytoene synthase
MGCTFPAKTGSDWTASQFDSSAHAAVADDALKDFDTAGFVRDFPAAVRPAWLQRIRAIRLADRLAENQELDPEAGRFDKFIADQGNAIPALQAVREEDGSQDGPQVLEAWGRYLKALGAYHHRGLRLQTLSQHRTMLDALSGSLFQILPFLQPKHFEAVRAFGALDQFFNNLRDLAEDAAHGVCYFPEDVLARAGLRSEDVLGDGWRTAAGWQKLMRFWLDEYLPELEKAAAGFDACDDLHPSVQRMRSECRARYQRILHSFRAAGYDFHRFAEEYWSDVRVNAVASETARRQAAAI